MTRKKVLILLGSICLALMLALPMVAGCAAPTPAPTPTPSPTPAPPHFDWTYVAWWGPGDHDAEVNIPRRIQIIEDETNGGITFTAYVNSELLGYDDQLSGISSGIAEVADAYAGSFIGVEPAWGILCGTPYIARDPFGDAYALNTIGPASDIIKELYADQNIHNVGWHDWGPTPVYISTVPIRTLEDWKGLKVRDDSRNAMVLEKLGAEVVFLPGTELYQSLMLGTIDVASWTTDGIKNFKLYEVADYLIMPPPIQHCGGNTIINMDAWLELPESYQEAIYYAEKVVCLESSKFYCETAMEWNLKTAPELGYFEVIYLSDEHVEAMKKIAIEEVWEELAAQSPLSAEVIELVKQWYGED